jgi:hypothetical protein
VACWISSLNEKDLCTLKLEVKSVDKNRGGFSPGNSLPPFVTLFLKFDRIDVSLSHHEEKDITL